MYIWSLGQVHFSQNRCVPIIIDWNYCSWYSFFYQNTSGSVKNYNKEYNNFLNKNSSENYDKYLQ